MLLVFDYHSAEPALALYKDNQWFTAYPDQDHASATSLPGVCHDFINRYGSISNVMALAVYTGPGSFAGIRASISFAQGLACNRKLPIYGLHSCAIVHALYCAAHPGSENPVWVAHREKDNAPTFFAYYSDPLAKVATPQRSAPFLPEPTCCIGNGWHSNPHWIPDTSMPFIIQLGTAALWHHHNQCGIPDIIPFYGKESYAP